MSSVTVIQARMGSTRLPGKVLAPLAGVPVLALVVRRLRACSAPPPIIVATSALAADDPIAALAADESVEVVRGSEHDVLARMWSAVESRSESHVVRITADCPFIDPHVVADAVRMAESSGADYVSNSLVRTYPDGLDVEVVRRDVLGSANQSARLEIEREHVTPHFYRRPDRYSLEALISGRLLGAERWTLDDPDDLARLMSLADALGDPIATGWIDIATIAGIRNPIGIGVKLVPALFDVAPDVPASTPARRTWRLTEDGTDIGWVMVTAADGIGQLRWEVPAHHQATARALLEQHLRADLQVDELVG